MAAYSSSYSCEAICRTMFARFIRLFIYSSIKRPIVTSTQVTMGPMLFDVFADFNFHSTLWRFYVSWIPNKSLDGGFCMASILMHLIHIYREALDMVHMRLGYRSMSQYLLVNIIRH